MYEQLLKRFALIFGVLLSPYIVVLILIGILVANIGNRVEPFAPELWRDYVLTEDLTLTSLEITLPGLFQLPKEVPFVMTHDEYRRTKEIFGESLPLPNLGKVPKTSRVRAIQVFTYDDLNGSTRYGTLSDVEKLLTAYARWKYIGSKLKEVP